MARVLTEAALSTRNARSKLPAGVHWRAVDPSVHLGYRRSQRGGRWLVRWRNGKGYRQHPLGTADDVLEADGVAALSFAQALAAARDHVEAQRFRDRADKVGPPPTVRSAADAYLSAKETRQEVAGFAALRDTRSRFGKYVLADEIADAFLHELNARAIAAWRRRVRTATASEATLRRISNDFRAALRHAYSNNRDRLPQGFLDEVREGFAITAVDPPVQSSRPNFVLPDPDVRRIIAAAAEVDAEGDWGGDLHRVVLVLAATGCRFSQAARVTVADLQFDLGRLLIPPSRKGRGASKPKGTAVPIGADVLSALRPAAAGRRGHELLLTTWGYRRIGRLQWERDYRRGWQPSELTKPFAVIVERAGLPPAVTAYTLRHSSIVRGIRAGLPIRLVAALHDTSTGMIEAHYTSFIVDATEELAARAITPLVTSPARLLAVDGGRQ